GGTAAVQLVVTPLLVWKLGTSAFALVGFYTTLVAVLAILDLGLTPHLTRVMARHLPSVDAPWRGATVLRTFEILFAGIGLVVAVAIVSAAPLWQSTGSGHPSCHRLKSKRRFDSWGCCSPCAGRKPLT